MAKWYEAANEASFKRTAVGHVYQCPPTWLIGRSSYYLVSDTQRAAITAVLGRWRLLLIVSLLTVFAFVGAYVAFVTPHNYQRIVEPALHVDFRTFFLVATALMATVCMVAILAPQIYLMRSLRPLLADAPRTDERIGMRDQLTTIAATASSKVLVAGLAAGGCLIVAAGLGFLDLYFDGDAAHGRLPISQLMFFGGFLSAGLLLIGYFLYLLRLRAGAKRTAPISL